MIFKVHGGTIVHYKNFEHSVGVFRHESFDLCGRVDICT